MADLTITAANVVANPNASVDRRFAAGGAITAGMAVYLDAADSKWKAADADLSADAAAVGGIALHGASSNQPLAVQTGGVIAIGAAVTVGEIYVASGTAGGIAPVGDLASGDWVSLIGIGISATAIRLAIANSGVQVPA